MIFLTHSWTNKPVARRLVEAFAREGLPAWIDENQLGDGELLRPELHEAIAGCDVYLYLVSEASNASAWCQDELRFAIAREPPGGTLKVIPVRLADDATPLPALLAGRLYRSLSPAAGGPGRFANELKPVAAVEVPPRCDLSATVRLLATGLNHTLDEARLMRGDAAVQTLFLDPSYERLDLTYWSLAEQQFPVVGPVTKAVEDAVAFVDGLHKQSRNTITELRALSERYVRVASDGAFRAYFESGYLQSMRVLLTALSWNCEYLVHLKESSSIEAAFLQRRTLPQPFQGHVCDFGHGTQWVGGVRVPEHGHPWPDGAPVVAWGLSRPFADMPQSEVGKALGHAIALRFLAGTLPSTEMLDPVTLEYGLG